MIRTYSFSAENLVSITDPARGEIKITLSRFQELYTGKVIVLTKTNVAKTSRINNSSRNLYK